LLNVALGVEVAAYRPYGHRTDDKRQDSGHRQARTKVGQTGVSEAQGCGACKADRATKNDFPRSM